MLRFYTFQQCWRRIQNKTAILFDNNFNQPWVVDLSLTILIECISLIQKDREKPFPSVGADPDSMVAHSETEWKRNEFKTRNDWRTLTIAHLSIWKITFVTKSIFDRSHERCRLIPAMILTLWKSLSRSQWDSNWRERERENP